MRNQMQVPGMPVQTPAQQLANSDAEIRRLKRILRSFGYTQLVIGLTSFVLGAVLLVDVHDNFNSYNGLHSAFISQRFRINLGEGTWCGIWIIAAGSLGIACGKKTVSQHLINSYLAFSILAAGFSAIMFALSIHVAESYTGRYIPSYPLGFGVEHAITGFGIISLVLCIVSASFCCCWASKIVTHGATFGCCGCCQNESDANTRNMYVVPNTRVPPSQQGIQSTMAVHYRPDIQSRQLPNPHQHLAADQQQKIDHSAAYQNTMQHNSGYNNPSMSTQPQSYSAE